MDEMTTSVGDVYSAQLTNGTLVGTAKDAVTKDTSAKDTSAKDTSAKDTSANDTSAKDTSANDTSAKDTSAKDTSAKDTSANDTSAKDTSAKDTSAKDTSTKIGGAAVIKCQAADNNVDAVCSNSSCVSSSETDKDNNVDAVCSNSSLLTTSEKGLDKNDETVHFKSSGLSSNTDGDILETVEDSDSVLKPHITEPVKSIYSSGEQLQDERVTETSTAKELGTSEETLRQSDDINGQISSTPSTLAQEEGGVLNDANSTEGDADDPSSRATESVRALGTEDGDSGGTVVKQEMSSAVDTATDECSSSGMEVEAGECQTRDAAADVRDVETEDGIEQDEVSTAVAVLQEFGDSGKTHGDENKIIDSCKNKDVSFGVTSHAGDVGKKPGETEDQIEDVSNNDEGRVTENNVCSLSEDEKRSSVEQCESDSPGDGASHEQQATEEQNIVPAEIENDCCKNDDKPTTEVVANEENCCDYVHQSETDQNLAEIIMDNKLENESKILEGNNSQDEREIQTKVTPEERKSIKSDTTVNKKQLLEDKNISGDKLMLCEVLESQPKSQKENDVIHKSDDKNSEKNNGEGNVTSMVTSEKSNDQEIPDKSKIAGIEEGELELQSSDVKGSDQDVCITKSDIAKENSSTETNGEQDENLEKLSQLEDVAMTESQKDLDLLHQQTRETSSDKKDTSSSCDTSGLIETTDDKKQVEVATATMTANKEAILPCNKSQQKREPRAKMSLSPNRMMGKPSSVSSLPAVNTSFGTSRNKLAAARKTLVNLVSNKGWCSILRQTSKSDDPAQLCDGITSCDNNSKINSSKDTEKSGSGSTRLTLVKAADGKQFLIKTPSECSLSTPHPAGKLVKQVILVSNPPGIALGSTGNKEVDTKTIAGKTGMMATPGKENSCLLPMPSTTHKLPVQKARKSAHQTARKAQIAAYESGNNNRAHALNPFTNMTIKVPDLENALGIKQKSLNKLDAKTLDKILLDNVQRAIKKQDTTFHKAPVQVSSITNVSTILVGQSILRRKKKRRMGMYKLPDLKKKMKKKSKKGEMMVKDEQGVSDALMESSAADEGDPAKTDIQKLLGQLKMKRRRRPKLWACGKVYKPPTKVKTLKTADVTPQLLQAKVEMMDDDTMTTGDHKWSNSVIGTPLVLNTTHQLTPQLTPQLTQQLTQQLTPQLTPQLTQQLTQQPSPEDQKSDVVGNRRSRRKRKGTIDDDTWSVTPAAGDYDMSPISTSRGVKQRRVDSEGGDIPVLLPACTLSDISGTDCLSAPPHISPQKTICAATCSTSNRQTQSDKMVYTHPFGSMPGQLQQKLKAMSPQQADHPAPSGGSLLKYVSTPNGMTFPLSPAKPDDTSKYPVGRKSGHVTNRHASADEAERDFIPLCCCKINGASFANLKQVIYCQALDSIDGKVVGCCNKVTNGQLVRSAVKIPFMAVCEQHRKRLRLHQCCPGCGHFCTQGKFYQCKKEGSMGVHHFHKQCQVFRDSKYYCPHCGAESHQVEVNLKLHDPTKLSLQQRPQRLSTVGPRARIGVLSPKSAPPLGAEDLGVSISVRTTSTNKEISTAGMPLGPSRTELENIITLISNDKPKKLRTSSKSLYAASYAGEVEKVLAILLDGGDPNVQFEEFNKQTALHAASIGGYLSIVHLLIQAGASPHVNDQNLCTAAICAAEYGQTAVVRYLIKAGAIANAKGQDGMTCLHLAAKCGSVDTVKYLVEMTEADVNIKDDGGWTPLVWATESCHLAVVRYMLLVGADPNIRDNEENTGLHWAAYAGCVDVAELFLNAGCCLEAANEHGDRPLHIAARQDHYECIVLFLARGADSEARNNNNKSAISCCVDQNGQVWMALRVNKQLKGFATQRLHQPEQLLHRDISMGREANPLPVVNGVDEENYPTDFQYLMNNAETSPMNINHVITSLQCCQCRDNCCSTFCICSRNSVKCWYDKEGRLLKDFNYMDPPIIFECNKACSCWANCRNRVIQLGIICRLQVFRTSGRGWGVRTLLNIPQGTFVCEYIGELISDTVADNREDDSYLFDLDNKESDTYCIDARRYGNVSRFINHLCEPNLLPVKVFVEHQDLRFPRMCFFATRDIKANEELGFDYGEKFWIIKWKHFTCTCGSTKCKYSATTIHQTITDYNLRMAEDNAVLN